MAGEFFERTMKAVCTAMGILCSIAFVIWIIWGIAEEESKGGGGPGRSISASSRGT